MTGSNWRGNLGNTEESSRKGAGMQGHGKPPKNRAWNERLHMAREGRKRTRYVTRSGVGECPWHYYRDYTEIEYTGKRKNKREIQATRRVENLESTKEYKVSGQRLGKPLRPRIEMYDLMIIMTSEIVKRTRHITQIVIVNLQGKIERNLLEWITFEKENRGTGREKNRESKE